MIKKVPTQEEMIEESRRQEEQAQVTALNTLTRDVAAAIVEEYTPTKNQLIIEQYEIGRGAFIGKYSTNLAIALNRNGQSIGTLARKLAEKTIYELTKKAGPLDYLKVKLVGNVLKAGKHEQPLFYMTTEMLQDELFKVHLEEPKKPEPDLREVPGSFSNRLEGEIARYTLEFQRKVKEGKIILMTQQRETVLYRMDVISRFFSRLSDEGLRRLSAAAIPQIGNLTDLSGIKVKYDEENDELTLEGTVVGERGTAEVYGIPVEYWGRKWFSMTEGQKSEKWPKVTGTITLPKR